MNFTQGQVRREEDGLTWLALPDGQAWNLPGSGGTPLLADGQHVVLGLRPEHLCLAPEGLALRVVLTESTGDKTQIYGTVAGSETPWCVCVHDRVGFTPGDLEHLQVRDAASTHCLDAQTQRHLGFATPAHAGYRPAMSRVDVPSGCACQRRRGAAPCRRDRVFVRLGPISNSGQAQRSFRLAYVQSAGVEQAGAQTPAHTMKPKLPARHFRVWKIRP